MTLDKHCLYCGRQLVDVTERSPLHDPATGERRSEVWRQCPRFPRNGIQSMFRGLHQSYLLDNPIMGRRWK